MVKKVYTPPVCKFFDLRMEDHIASGCEFRWTDTGQGSCDHQNKMAGMGDEACAVTMHS